MILHCTQKMAGKLQEVSHTPLAETSQLGSWHANLLAIDRRLCVIFCHDQTRYSLFLPGLRKAHFTSLGPMHRDFFLATLATLGVRGVSLHRVVMAMGPARFDMNTDLFVVDAMQSAKNDLRLLLGDKDVMDSDPLDLSLRLNDRPAAVKGEEGSPRQAMLALVERLGGSSGNAA